MEEHYTIKHEKYDDVVAVINILNDGDHAYLTWEDIEGAEITVADTRDQFWRNANEHGLSQEDIHTLVLGDIVFVDDDNCYIGLEMYEHSGRVYAMCGRGNFPDRQWDVSPIVGWINPAGVLRQDLIRDAQQEYAPDAFMAQDKLREELQKDIDLFNDAINGNCWGYRVTLLEDDEEVGEPDSCWGFLGDSDYCKEQAEDVDSSK